MVNVILGVVAAALALADEEDEAKLAVCGSSPRREVESMESL